jgi:hypothetical protein
VSGITDMTAAPVEQSRADAGEPAQPDR